MDHILSSPFILVLPKEVGALILSHANGLLSHIYPISVIWMNGYSATFDMGRAGRGELNRVFP
jgi:hypothetical protein